MHLITTVSELKNKNKLIRNQGFEKVITSEPRGINLRYKRENVNNNKRVRTKLNSISCESRVEMGQPAGQIGFPI